MEKAIAVLEARKAKEAAEEVNMVSLFLRHPSRVIPSHPLTRQAHTASQIKLFKWG